MKKRTILSFVSTLAIVGGTFACLTSCGGEKATINNTYAYGVVEANSYGGNTTSTYQLNFLTDSTYELINSSITIGYGMNLGTETVSTYGTYTVGASEDGYTAYTLSTATRVILNSYSDMGGFAIYIDTESASQTYPAELPAETEGQKIYAQNKEEVINKYGKESTIYVSDTNHKFYLTNPNA